MSEYYSAIQKEILLFVTTQMDLEGFMLNEMSDRKRQTLYDLIYMWNLEKMEEKKERQTKSIEKEIQTSDLWLSVGVGGGLLKEGGQRARTPGYMMNQDGGVHSVVTIVHTAVWNTKTVKKVNPKGKSFFPSSREKKDFFFGSI